MSIGRKCVKMHVQMNVCFSEFGSERKLKSPLRFPGRDGRVPRRGGPHAQLPGRAIQNSRKTIGKLDNNQRGLANLWS
jgi:hypothetical protein